MEAAYPDRFIRDASGRLTAIDLRPLNLTSSRSDMVTLNLSAGLPVPTSDRDESQIISINLNTKYRLRDVTEPGEGAPALDTLAGIGGGQPRQEVSLFIDTSRGRWSASTSAHWQSAYRLQVADRPGPGDLKIGDLTHVNLRATYRLVRSGRSPDNDSAGGRTTISGQIVLEIENLFDARPRAFLADGRTAPGYGRDDRDPIGRLVRLQVSRRF